MNLRLGILFAVSCLLTYANAATSASNTRSIIATVSGATGTYSQSNVPTGTPLPGNYDEPLRPQVHFSPPIGFMNVSGLSTKTPVMLLK